MAMSIELDPATERRLDSLVSLTGRAREVCLRDIIERGLDDLEDYVRAIEVLERVRNGTERTCSAAEVRRALELED